MISSREYTMGTDDPCYSNYDKWEARLIGQLRRWADESEIDSWLDHNLLDRMLDRDYTPEHVAEVFRRISSLYFGHAKRLSQRNAALKVEKFKRSGTARSSQDEYPDKSTKSPRLLPKPFRN